MTNRETIKKLSDLYHEERTKDYKENTRIFQERFEILASLKKPVEQVEKQESYHAYIARRYKEIEELTNDR